MARVYLSVGTNIDRANNVRCCLQALRERFGALAVSTVYESDAVGCDSPPFYNLAVGFDTELDVHALVRVLREIEHRQGRRRSGDPCQPRTLDLDLLLYDQLVMDDNGVQLPRAEIARYAFVLKPLAEIAADLAHPLEGRTYAELWRAFDADEQPLWPVRLSA